MNKTYKKLFLFLFFLTGAIEVTIIWFEMEPVIEHFVKPLIIPSLIGYYYFSVSKSNPLYLIALIFAFLGDSFLMYSDSLYFTIGIGCFWVTQICLSIICFQFAKGSSIGNYLIALVIFAIYLTGMIGTLYPGMGLFKIPVIIYSVTISIFGVLATTLWFKFRGFAFLILLGSILFIISDSMIALNRFYFNSDLFGIWVMVTYILAQFFICRYMIVVTRVENSGKAYPIF